MTPRVALIGASGHGVWHRRQIARLEQENRLKLVGLCDVRPIKAFPGAPVPADMPAFNCHVALLKAVRPDVVVVCTPPHTHLEMATEALAWGADVLLEKPPVLSLTEHDALAKALAETGRACQVGFQALGSAALAELIDAVTGGRLGNVTGIAAVASWQRDDAYYQRSPWAGRRILDGQPVLDGALANPLAHALMQSLAVVAAAAGEPVMPDAVEVERYRTRPIEVDDTAVLRAGFDSAPPMLAAVTLCGEDKIEGEIIVYGTAGTAVLEYPTDRLRLPADADFREVPGRVELLENLLDHRADPTGTPLIAPLARTAPFTALLETIADAPDPADVPSEFVVPVGEPPAQVRTITGVNAVLRAAAEKLSLPSELGVPWATTPYVSRNGKRIANIGDN
jgi:predicted dehydrogenase